MLIFSLHHLNLLEVKDIISVYEAIKHLSEACETPILTHVNISVIGPGLSNLSISDSEIKCTLSKSAGDTKLCSVVDTAEGQDAIHRDLDRLSSGPR